MPKKKSNKNIVSKAAKTLQSDKASKRAKTTASKTLLKAKVKKAEKAKKAASAASKVLRDSKSSKAAKSAAASTLATGGRVVKTPKGVGKINKSKVRRAVKIVSARKHKTH